MEKTVLCAFFILFTISGTAQEEKFYFSEAIALHLPKYKEEAKEAYYEDNIERARFLFDSLVNYCLKGSFLDNFQLKDLNKNEVFLDEFEKPVFLKTQSSWLTPSEGAIPALNKLASEYEDRVEFVVVFWDEHSATKESSKAYRKNIKILYVDELSNRNGHIVRTMKHSLGLPTNFLLSADKKILDITRAISHPYGISFKESFNLSYNSILANLTTLLINDGTKDQIIEERRLAGSTTY